MQANILFISLYSFCRYFPSFLNASFRSPVYIWLYTNYDVYIRYFFIIILDTPWSILKWKPKKFGSDEFLLLFLWYISSLQLLFIFQTHVGWILDVLKWFSSWHFFPPYFPLFSTRFPYLYFSSESLFPDYFIIFFMIKAFIFGIFWLPIHKMAGSSGLMFMSYEGVRNAKMEPRHLVGGQPSKCWDI